jgi:HNH endonuclease
MAEPRISAQQKVKVAERAFYCCEYCHAQERYSPDSFSVEHITPLSKGGSSELNNLAFACQGCNNRKYNNVEAIDPVTQALAPLYHPRQHQWLDHFLWNEDCTLLLGVTRIGRATVEKLQLNRPGLVNLRKILYDADEHPPKLIS